MKTESRVGALPSSLSPFVSSEAFRERSRILVPEKRKADRKIFLDSLSALFDAVPVTDGMTLSFHHHLRNGDSVFNAVCEEIRKRNLRGLTLAPSSVFPNQGLLAELIENGNVVSLRTNYLNGPAARPIEEGKMQGLLWMDTHGGRHRAIESGELRIDLAILAAPAVDREGNGTGTEGPAACGTLGYAQSDLRYAKKVSLITDTLVERVKRVDLDGAYVDYVVKTESIGDPKGIASGTTRITKDPVGLKIARDAVRFLEESGALREGFSMQTGAGGTSLAVARYVRERMKALGIRGSFASGGITGPIASMLGEDLFDQLFDVQCFDLDAVRSYRDNPRHRAMSASGYANPYEPGAVADRLSFVILGATEIDLGFNVNVTTDSFGRIIGGSGGHADVAHGAGITVIVTNLAKARLPILRERLTTITTPGEDVDVLVTERGIAVNPRRSDLLERLKGTRLDVVPIEELLKRAHRISGVPAELPPPGPTVGYVVYRDGTVLDRIARPPLR